jgi:hypothetical protein
MHCLNLKNNLQGSVLFSLGAIPAIRYIFGWSESQSKDAAAIRAKTKRSGNKRFKSRFSYQFTKFALKIISR